jgi:hypothetical protein
MAGWKISLGAFFASLLLPFLSLTPALAQGLVCGTQIVTDAVGNKCQCQQLTAGPHNESLCPNSPASFSFGPRIARAVAAGGTNYYQNYEDDDPYASYSRIRINPVTTLDTLGNQGIAAGSTTSVIGAGADGHIDASKLFDIKGDNQRLSIGAYFDYNSLNTIYDASALGASTRQNLYSVGGIAAYRYNDIYLQFKLGGLWGSGTSTDTTGAIGNFGSSGYQGNIAAGRIFTLFDTRSFVTQKPIVKAVKAPPQTKQTGGYLIGLDVSGNLATYSERIGAFTDSSGFINGAEQLSYWELGSRARLFAEIMDNKGLVWTPYVALSVTQQVAFSHTQDLIAQATQAAGSVQFDAPGLTYFGFLTGVSVLDTKGIRYGADFSYYRSSGVESTGGRVYVKFPLVSWLGLAR